MGACVIVFFRSLALVKSQFLIRLFQLVLTVCCLLIAFQWDILGVALAVLLSNLLVIFVKLIFITRKIKSSFRKVLFTILSAWKFAVILVPVMICTCTIVPKTIFGDMIILVVFIFMLFLSFVFTPIVVGERYKNEAYEVLKSKLFRKGKTN